MNMHRIKCWTRRVAHVDKDVNWNNLITELHSEAQAMEAHDEAWRIYLSDG